LVTITTDAGTEITVPLSELGFTEDTDGDEPGTPSEGSAEGSSEGSASGSAAGLGFAGVLAAIAGIAAFVGLSGQFDQFIPANMQRTLNDLRRQINTVSPIQF
ncbi:MAG: bifunctional metallophosphatase/5'-nucleotidase, partial [Corynebacterium casei]|nr:bifunctional metallophosphatase/5'-nucleotidase [Corynebacterium casei]MDN5923271.1 bifunctional metallophosphatase/5'-nucleotidase [Corynebacterium casei]MDN6286397.1 bifunctional metallophosphatase/5'-nucleotidase [Corynebacterium casei]MDN6313559.1 bifunctional metallophosphatase/5'-nucleotidase [Corynebacterium casei]MDN6361353.1 bifunctional metallophosphatase/5'-nucleotidase [Corynebacterium casei]